MNEEIFGILNDADEVMESVGCDPLGMNTVMEAKYVNLNTLTAKDLEDPENVNAITTQLGLVKSVDKLVALYLKFNKIMLAASGAVTGLGVAGGDVVTGAMGLYSVIVNAIIRVIAKRIKKSISNKSFGDLEKVDKALTTSIEDMKKALPKASGEDKKKLEASIQKAEALKQYVTSNLEKQTNNPSK